MGRKGGKQKKKRLNVPFLFRKKTAAVVVVKAMTKNKVENEFASLYNFFHCTMDKKSQSGSIQVVAPRDTRLEALKDMVNNRVSLHPMILFCCVIFFNH
jgi:hypothetical protein